MGYRLNRLDEPVFMAGPKPMLTEFGIHYRLESCATNSILLQILLFVIEVIYLPGRLINDSSLGKA